MHNLFRNVKVTRSVDYTAASATSTDINGGILDMAGFEGVAFVALINGTPTSAGFLMKAEMGTSSSLSTGNAVEIDDSAVNVTTSIANGILILDVYKPQYRYVRCVLDRVTTDDIPDGVLAFQYGAGNAPVTHSTADLYTAEYANSPSSGAAT